MARRGPRRGPSLVWWSEGNYPPFSWAARPPSDRDTHVTFFLCWPEWQSAASQMTAAKVMDIISMPGCAGQTADAVSAKTQVKMEDAHKLLKIPKSECPDIWIRLPRQMAKIMVQYGRSSRSTWAESVRSPFGRTVVGKAIWEILLKHGWEKIPNWECLFEHHERGFFSSVYVDDIKLAGKRQNLDPMWKLLNKEVDLGEPTSFLDHVNFGCTHRQCEMNKRYCWQFQNHV